MRFGRVLMTILIVGLPLGAYVPRRTLTSAGLALERWAEVSFPITWRLNPNRGPNVSGSRGLADVLHQAFLAWSSVPTARVSFVEGTTATETNAAQDGINLISFVSTGFNSQAPSLTVLYTIANPSGGQFPGQILEADILFNPQALLSTDVGVEPDRYDLQSLAVHEIGHLLGLDHSGLVSAALFPTVVLGNGRGRLLSADDVMGVSNIYPSPAFYTTRGTVAGLVRSPAGMPLFGAHVVLVDGSGNPIASTLSEVDGSYSLHGLEPGNYSAYAEPLDNPLNGTGIQTLGPAFPNLIPDTAFTSRFAVATESAPALTLTKSGGDNQAGKAGQPLAQQIEVTARDNSGNPLVGVLVRFAAASGGGAVVPTQSATDALGKARTTVYLSDSSIQTFVATSRSTTVTFTATIAPTPATISNVTFVEPGTNSPASELVVNEGNNIQAGLRIVDSTGAVRTDVSTTYVSLDPDIATVDASGTIQGKKAGFSTLTVTAGGLVATATITVVQVKSSGVGIEAVGVAQDQADRLYLAARQEHTIRRADSLTAAPQIYAGRSQMPGFVNDVRTQALFNSPSFLALDHADGSLYLSDSANNAIRRIRPGSADHVETLAGTGTAGSLDGPAQTATFNNPQGIALDNVGNLWVADSGNHTIRRINLQTRTVQTVAGLAGTSGSVDGTGAQARLNSPVGLAIEPETLSAELERFRQTGAPSPVSVIVADSGNGAIRRVKATGQVETFQVPGSSSGFPLVLSEGTAGMSALSLTFGYVGGLAVDVLGNIFFALPNQGLLKVILRNGEVVNAAQANTFRLPAGIAIGRTGRAIVTDGNNQVQEIGYSEPQISSLAPASLSDRGGATLTIRGKNFAPDSVVIIRGVLMNDVKVSDTQSIRVTVPRLPSGLTTLTVQHRGGLAQTSVLIEPVPLSLLAPGEITTVVGGSTSVADGTNATAAPLAGPRSIAIDTAGNTYVADEQNSRIRKIDGRTGVITTVAGTGQFGFSGDGGPAVAAALSYPTGVAVDKAGNIFVADSANRRIRKVSASTGIITTVAGTGLNGFSGDGGPALSAAFSDRLAIAIDRAGNLFIADSYNRRIRRVDSATGMITTVAGTGVSNFSGDGGPATDAGLSFPTGIALDEAGNLFIAADARVRKVSATTRIITTVAGNGQEGFAGDGGLATAASFAYPQGIAMDAAGNLFIADTDNNVVRRVAAATGIVTTVAGTGQLGFSGDGGLAIAASFSYPQAVAVDGAGGLYIADTDNNVVRKVDAVTGKITRLGGTGQLLVSGDSGLATAATLSFTQGITVDDVGNLFIADTGFSSQNSYGHRIRKVTAATGIITTVAGTGRAGFSGDDGLATNALLKQPEGVAVDAAGNLFIADTDNGRVRKVVRTTGIITTVAGGGSSGDGGLASSTSLLRPRAMALDAAGNLFVADWLNHRVRKVAGATGIISTFAGGGSAGDGAAANTASVPSPRGLALDGAGNLFLTSNGKVRKVSAVTGIITSEAGSGASGFSGDGGLATQASFGASGPEGIAVDGAGNLFIADPGNHRIRKVTASTGIISTVAGTGQFGFSGDGGSAVAASLAAPTGLTIDAAGNLFFTADDRIRAIRGIAVPGISSPPAITSISPSSATAGTSVNATISGAGLGDVSAVTFGGTGVTATILSGGSDTNLPITIAIASDAVPGLRTIRITGPRGTSSFAGFNVDLPPPTITSSSPSSAAQGSAVTVTITGTNFVAGATSVTASGTGVVISEVNVLSATSLTATLSFHSTAAVGPRNIIVATSSGTSSPATFSVVTPSILYGQPEISSIVPTKISHKGGATVTITGNNFLPDSLVLLGTVLVNAVQVHDKQTLSFSTPSIEDNGRVPITVQTRGGLVQSSVIVTPTPLSELLQGQISTIAGSSRSFIGDGSPATSASLAQPSGIAIDVTGNVYIADAGHHRIRRIDGSTGIITTIAGTGLSGFSGDGGPAVAASLSATDLAIDHVGNLFVIGSGRIRKLSAATAIMTAVGGNGGAASSGDGGQATAASFGAGKIATDSLGNLFIADTDNSRIRKIAPMTGIITTVAGTGARGFSGDANLATAASLDSPGGVAVDGAGNLFIADTGNSRIRKVSGTTGVVTTIAGTGTAGFSGDGGPATTSTLRNPTRIAIDETGNVFVVDSGNYRVRRIAASTGIITTVAGNGTPGYSGDGTLATTASVTATAIAIDGAGNLFIAGDDRLRKVSAASGVITTAAGSAQTHFAGDGGPAVEALLYSPRAAIVDRSGNVFIADTSNNRVRKVEVSTGVITTVAGTGASGFSGDGGPATNAAISVDDVAVDGAGNVFITDVSNDRVRKITAATGIITTVVGTGVESFSGDGGPAVAASLSNPVGIAIDGFGNLFIADRGNNRIRKVAASTGIMTTVAGTGVSGFSGDGDQATAASLDNPAGVAIDADGNLYIADRSQFNWRVRKVTAATGIITTVAGGGTLAIYNDGQPATAARLEQLDGITVDGAGNIFIAELTGAYRVRKIAPTTGIITTVAGSIMVQGPVRVDFSGDGGPATAARLNAASGVAVDGNGNLWISDTGNDRIRVVRGVAVPPVVPPLSIAGVNPSSAKPGIDLEATITGSALNSATGVTFSGTGVTATIRAGGTDISLPITITIAPDATPGLRTLMVTTAGGTSAPFSGFSVLGPPSITSMSPTSAEQGSAVLLQIAGTNFLSGATAVIAGGTGVVVSDVNVMSATSLTALIAFHSTAIPGSRSITVATSIGTSTASALAVVAPAILYGQPEISSVAPDRVSQKGGAAVTVRGRNFMSNSIVSIAGVAVTAVQVQDTQTLSVTIPAIQYTGRIMLSVQNRGGSAQTSILVEPPSLSDLLPGQISTVAGSGLSFIGDGSAADSALLVTPKGIAMDVIGNLYIADSGNHRVRRIDAHTGIITTVAGTGLSGFSGDGGPATAAMLRAPGPIAVDAAGNLFIADTVGLRIRKVAAATGIITTVAGTGVFGSSVENAPAATVPIDPRGIAVDNAGNIFVSTSHRVRKISVATGIISTVAGSGSAGFSGDGGPATSAMLNNPGGIALDNAGNLFIADTLNQRIRKVDGASGIITTIVSANASLSNPLGIVVDGTGNLFIADTSRIRKVAAVTGIITTVAGVGSQGLPRNGQLATQATLSMPEAIAVDPSDNLFIADTGNHRVHKISASTGILTIIAGGYAGFSGDGGPSANSFLSSPEGAAVDGAGNLFIADSGNHRIRKVAASTGIITTVAGTGVSGFSGDGGTAESASLDSPSSVTVDTAGNLFIADWGNSRIRKVSAGSGIITTVADNIRTFNIVVDATGDLFFIDSGRIFKITAVTGIITSVAGNGIAGYSGDGGAATAASIRASGIAIDSAGNLFIADGSNDRIRKVAAATGIIDTVAGTGVSGFSGDGGLASIAMFLDPTSIALDTAGNLFVVDRYRVRKISAVTGIITTVAGTSDRGFFGDGGPAIAAWLNSPASVSVNTSGDLFIADLNNDRVRKVAAATGIITTVAGNGPVGLSDEGQPATAASLVSPMDVAVDGAGNLFIADGHRVRKVAATTGNIITVGGTGEDGFSPDTLREPRGLAVDKAGNLFIADTGNHRIRRIAAATGMITTLAGTGVSGFSGDGGPGTAANLNLPEDIAVDDTGNVFFADTGNHRIRKVAAGTGTITTVAGTGLPAFSGDGGPATSAALNGPAGIAVDGAGNLYIADNLNGRIRKIAATTGTVITVATISARRVATDGTGNPFVSAGHAVIKIDAATSTITTIAGTGGDDFSGDGGPATGATFRSPQGIAMDAAGNLYVADSGNKRIRVIRAVAAP